MISTRPQPPHDAPPISNSSGTRSKCSANDPNMTPSLQSRSQSQLPSPSPSPSPASTSSPSPPPPPPPLAAIPSPSPATAPSRTPETHSINHVMRSHSRDRLYVRPLQWTSRHLHLLGCRFAHQESLPPPPPRPPPQPRRMRQRPGHYPPAPPALRSLADDLLCPSLPKYKTGVIRTLLEGHGIAHQASDVPFRFGSHPVATLSTDGVFAPSTDADSTACLMAYLDLETVKSRRNTSVKLSTSRANRLNPPVARLGQKIQRRLRPSNEAEDPYIAAVLISLAQQRRSRHVDSTSDAPKCQKVCLLARPTGPRCLYFYTARFSHAFLDRLDMPSRYSPSSDVIISVCRIPLLPMTRMATAMNYMVSVVHGVDVSEAGHVETVCSI
ncbi:hypothetical protein QBC39DRAFT_158620 [Podospora conica]|nr:hypothetical protein QBC39DRAFT_158620 [Schizothecium conicum]